MEDKMVALKCCLINFTMRIMNQALLFKRWICLNLLTYIFEVATTIVYEYTPLTYPPCHINL